MDYHFVNDKCMSLYFGDLPHALLLPMAWRVGNPLSFGEVWKRNGADGVQILSSGNHRPDFRIGGLYHMPERRILSERCTKTIVLFGKVWERNGADSAVCVQILSSGNHRLVSRIDGVYHMPERRILPERYNEAVVFFGKVWERNGEDGAVRVQILPTGNHCHVFRIDRVYNMPERCILSERYIKAIVFFGKVWERNGADTFEYLHELSIGNNWFIERYVALS